MYQNISFSKYLLFCALGFGLGGALWGWVLYQGIPDVEYPFHFMAIIIMGLFGGLALTWFSKSIKEISKAVVAGFLGFGIGFFSTAVFAYFLSLYGSLFLSALGYLIEIETLNRLINLDPDVGIGDLWLMFLSIGAIVGLFYAIFLKLKIWPLIWRGGLGFALGSLIGPVIGNVLGGAINSLLAKYLISFAVIGLVLALFLGWGIYRLKTRS